MDEPSPRPHMTLVIGGSKSPDPVDQHVGGRIMALRRARGLSQTELARRLSLSFQQVQKYETGVNRISASKLWAAGQALDVPMEDFFAGLDEGDVHSPRRLDGALELEAARLTPLQQKALVAFLRSVSRDE